LRNQRFCQIPELVRNLPSFCSRHGSPSLSRLIFEGLSNT
jgi:hypothetical protein